MYNNVHITNVKVDRNSNWPENIRDKEVEIAAIVSRPGLKLTYEDVERDVCILTKNYEFHIFFGEEDYPQVTSEVLAAIIADLRAAGFEAELYTSEWEPDLRH